MVSRNTTIVPSLGLRIGPACEAGLSAGMRRERVPPRIRKKKKEETWRDFSATAELLVIISMTHINMLLSHSPAKYKEKQLFRTERTAAFFAHDVYYVNYI